MNNADTETALRASEAPAAIGEKSALAFTGADKALVPGMLVCGFFWWEWIMFLNQPALGVSLFAVLLCGVTLLHLGRRGVRQNRASLPCLVVLGLSCAQFTVFDTTPLQFFGLALMSFAYLYWLSVSCGTRLSNRLSGTVAFDMLNQCALVPFGNMGALFLGARRGVSEMKRGKEFLAAAVGLIVFLPLFGVVLSLLTEADDAFGALWRAIRAFFDLPDFVQYAAEFVLGIPVAAYLYGAVFGNAARRRVRILNEDMIAKGLLRIRLVPNMAFCAPLVAFNAVYALFFVALGKYFFSAFAGRLPEAMSYAEYARKGFFELCGVATINLAIIACVYLLIRRNGDERSRAPRILTGLMSAFTVLLIVTAMSKMFLYISAYGLTRLRVYTSWFMLLLLIAFALILLWHFRAANPAKPLILVCVVGFMALTWANTDGLIAKYNIERYESGRAAALDLRMLKTLSDAAAPYLYAAWEREKARLADLPAYDPEDADVAKPGSPREERADESARLYAALKRETDPFVKADLERGLLMSLMRVALEKEKDPKTWTALELGFALLSTPNPYGGSDFGEWNAQSFRAAELSVKTQRDLAEIFLSRGIE
jgi:hypothetical protein